MIFATAGLVIFRLGRVMAEKDLLARISEGILPETRNESEARAGRYDWDCFFLQNHVSGKQQVCRLCLTNPPGKFPRCNRQTLNP